MSVKELSELIPVSRRYGADADYVVAGGGNTSYKDGKTLFVKASGKSLGTIDATGFVRMDMARLDALWNKTYSTDTTKREAEVLADMLAAREAGEEAKRPSVEALLHSLLPFKFVVHTHPALINGVTCGKNGRKLVEKIFGAEAIWIPSINPGYMLALAVRDDAAAFEKYHGKKVQIIFLENHGVFVAADRVFLINKIYADIVSRIAPRVKRVADMSYAFDTHADGNGMDTGIIAKTLTKDTGLVVKFLRNNEILRVTESASTFKTALGGAFTPDHIVYAGSKFLYSDTVQDVVYVVKDFISAN